MGGTSSDVLPVTCSDRTGQPFTVRPVHPEDRASLESFYDAFEPKRAAQGLPPAGRDRVAAWLGSVLDEGIHLAVEQEEMLVGHAFLVPAGRAGTAEYAIFLAARLRGRGLGTAVNRIAARVAKAAGYERVWLTVEPHNRAAIRSYEKAGFRFRYGNVFTPEPEMELDLSENA